MKMPLMEVLAACAVMEIVVLRLVGSSESFH